MLLDNTDFLTELSRGMPPDQRMILCWFGGDPNIAADRYWVPQPWAPGSRVPTARTNNYVAVSSFRAAPDGSWRRQTALFGAGRALMVDDVGTKVDPSAVRAAVPTARIETSPGNEQWWYFLAEPVLDQAKFDGAIRSFISSKLLGADPGMAGVNRVGRLPIGVNGKKKYGGWSVRTLDWAPDRRYTLADLGKALGITWSVTKPPPIAEIAKREHQKAQEDGRLDAFYRLKRWMSEREMVKREEANLGGWHAVRCPWTHEHTDGADSGAAIGVPNAENDFYGAFQCHHGHCQEKTLRHLMEWFNDFNAEESERINRKFATGEH